MCAPFDALVARRYVRAGQQVAKGDRLFWVTAEGPLRLRFTLAERFLGRLRKGQQVPLSSPDVPQGRYVAKVIEVSPVVDPASGTVEVLVEVVGASGQLRPGMTASVLLHNLLGTSPRPSTRRCPSFPRACLRSATRTSRPPTSSASMSTWGSPCSASTSPAPRPC